MRNENGIIIAAPAGFRFVMERARELLESQQATTDPVAIAKAEAELVPLRRQLDEWVRQAAVGRDRSPRKRLRRTHSSIASPAVRARRE